MSDVPQAPIPEPPKPSPAMQTIERLARIETLLLVLLRRWIVTEACVIALLVGLALLIGHVWR